MFSMTAFNQNIGSWNTGNVIDMNHTFYSSNFNQYINLWDTHSAKYMNGISFYHRLFKPTTRQLEYVQCNRHE
ncbi:MAG: BspA family leucine-rich repeat surface protein [Bacteroidetes bacterium]|nr:BspA family leucine-rich repeat surface protein [Bacteroidota bacterium]